MSTPLEVAQGEIGKTDPSKYWAVVDPPLAGDDWCGCFVTYSFQEAGQPLPKMNETSVSSGFVYCPDAETWAKANDWWVTAGQPGDIVLYNWSGGTTAQHTGIVESVAADGTVTAIEGNTGSPTGVYREVRNKSLVLGFLRPGGVVSKGVDSAYAPSVADVQTGVGQGISAWFFYRRGPGALHNWSNAEVQNLRSGGLTKGLPIFVPALTSSGRISPTANPENDASAFVADYQAAGVNGAGCLDTEASMRGDPWTDQYTARFCKQLRALNQADVCYAGGFTFSSPPQATYIFWIVPSQNVPANQCYQTGGGKVGSTSVDFDAIGANFPLANLVAAPPAPTPVVISSAYPIISGGPMPSQVFTVPTDANGNGWVLLDGSDARVNHLQVPWNEFVSITAQGGYPPVDGYVAGMAKPQDRNGYVCVQITQAHPNGQVNIILVTSNSASVRFISRGDAEALFGDEGIITHENWADQEAPAYGGGAHDPSNSEGQPPIPAESGDKDAAAATA